MRLSLWQQFSSNHSAMYTVVGVFESTDKAYAVAEEIRELLVEIEEWNSQEPKPDIGWQPNPIEERIALEHGFDWKEPVDWLRPLRRHYVQPYQRELEENIIQWDRLVVVDAPGVDTWQTGHQFANLLKALGAKTYSSIYMGMLPDTGAITGSQIEFDVVIDAPTSASANEIQRQMKLHLTPRAWERDLPHPIPWITYHPRYARLTNNLSREAFEEAEKTWLRETPAWQKYARNHWNDADFSERRSRFLTQDEQTYATIVYLRQSTTFSLKTMWERHNQRITLHGTASGDFLVDALPAFGAWLQAQGCTVSYEFREIS
jgi:hypothetical protein